jgi:hypothetical protein
VIDRLIYHVSYCNFLLSMNVRIKTVCWTKFEVIWWRYDIGQFLDFDHPSFFIL